MDPQDRLLQLLSHLYAAPGSVTGWAEFLEQVRRQGGRLQYLADGKWLPARERHETFIIKGERPVRETVYETRNGPLLNSTLGERKHPLQPYSLASACWCSESALSGASL